jgi:hypothetical protein
MARSIAFIVGAMVVAASGTLPASAESARAPCGDAEALTFENWRAWTKLTPKPIVASGHGGTWADIYLNDGARDGYLAATARYPRCAAIVKPLYSDAGATRILELMIMVKMPAGYDPENADWWYGVYDATGRKTRRRGKLIGCISCHAFAAETDYLFAEEVLEAIGK